MRIATNLKTKAMYTPNGLNDKEECLREYAPLVKRIAHHMMLKLPGSVEVDDLIQAGMMGLLDAASRYDELRGAQFETYAAQRIRGAMLDELRGADWLPRSMRRDMRRIEAAISRLQQKLGQDAERDRDRQGAGRVPGGIPADAAGSARRATAVLRGFPRRGRRGFLRPLRVRQRQQSAGTVAGRAFPRAHSSMPSNACRNASAS